ncbi:hypothetical protein HZB94_02380 [Candidatus Falkowbacteria bacterium]|nr:hypothetical protein [Candidatus Falkowbacteria bacterium]
MTKGDARNTLLRALTSDESLTLLAYFEIVCAEVKALSVHLKTIKEIRARERIQKSAWHVVSATFFFQTLHYIFMGEFPLEIETEKFLSKMAIIQDFLRLRPITAQNMDEVRLLFAPIGELLTNKKIGVAILTRHAWERFCERRPRNNGQRKVSHEDLLRASFYRAKIQDLSGPAKVRRIIDSGFKPAVYLYDSALDLRYVVAENILDGFIHPHIVTVERPTLPN